MLMGALLCIARVPHVCQLASLYFKLQASSTSGSPPILERSLLESLRLQDTEVYATNQFVRQWVQS